MKRSFEFFLLIYLWPVSFATNWGPESPSVSTSLGGIKGFYATSEDGRQYAAFESVPYAQPPVGELRFEPPVPVTLWNKDIEALTLPPPCAQFETIENLFGVEDCLYLNVYVPNANKTGQLPVIFWIHGGGFQFGASSQYGPKYLMDRDVIFVSINYRLGPLGFLSTGDAIVPGNMGLKDQALALKWVMQNIESFGGNPQKITLMGVSAGGVSVHYHYLSPLSRGLFRNGVSFSGTTLSTWAFTADGSDIAKSLAKALECPVDDSSLMIQCLKRLPVHNITDYATNLSKKYYFPIAPFPPVMEKITNNYFINDTPKNILKNGKIYDAPWIAGVVKDDGLFMVSGFILNKTLVEYTDKHWEEIGSLLLVLKNQIASQQQPIIVDKAREHYFHGNASFTTALNSTKHLTSLVGDGLFVVGSIEAATLQAKVNKSPVRYYHYTYRAAQSTSDFLSNSTINFGVCHSDDINLVLENKHMDPTTTEMDKAMLKSMLDYWYSIANDESPNLGTSWPPVNPDSKDLDYMQIAGPKDYTMKSADNLGEILFWNSDGL